MEQVLNSAEAEIRLRQMVGLTEVKERFASLRSIWKSDSEREDFSYPHMVFMGNPATGKSTVARLFGEILHADGLLSKGQFVSLAPHDLISQYGDTRAKALSACETANGGILFIDEAFGLSGVYGKEALEVLIQFMVTNRDSLVILAGPSEEMNIFLDTNPALKRRLANRFCFADYTDEELVEIFRSCLEKEHLTIDDKALTLAKDYFSAIPRNKAFGNAREAELLFDKVRSRQGGRLVDLSEPSDEDLFTILSVDFPNYVDSVSENGTEGIGPVAIDAGIEDGTPSEKIVSEDDVKEGDVDLGFCDDTEVLMGADRLPARMDALEKSLTDIQEVIGNIQYNVSMLVQNQASSADVAVMRKENEAFRSDSNMKLMRRYGIDAMIRTYQSICDRIFQLNNAPFNANTDGELKAFKWILKRLDVQFKSLGINLQRSSVGSPVNEATMVIYGSDGEDVDEAVAMCATNDESMKNTVKESVCPAFIWAIPSLIGETKEWYMSPEKVCIYK